MNKLFPDKPVLIIDDEFDALQSFEMTLKSGGINNLFLCNDSRTVMELLQTREFELILLDLTMPYISGAQLLPRITGEYPGIPVIIITGNNELETAVSCMQQGALDYIVKPVEKNRLCSSVNRQLEFCRLQRENLEMKNQLLNTSERLHPAFDRIITRSPAMRSIFRYVEVVATSPEPILITGETGSGKELIAKAIHTCSRRRGQFVSVNVAGLDDNVFSDTLFGHKRGAFTDAYQQRKGLIESAEGGTLFLDEIGDLEHGSQVKLLRLLQEHEYYPLGSDIPKKTSVNIIAATNKDIRVLQDSGTFRKDLFYRLYVHHVHIPPLRTRSEDIPLLVYFFMDEAAGQLHKKLPDFPDDLFALMYSYDFPGNIRELRSIIFDAVSSYRSGTMSIRKFREVIAAKIKTTSTQYPGNKENQPGEFFFTKPLPSIREAEIQLIRQAMSQAKGNQSVAAQILGIARQTLNRKLKALDIKEIS